MRVWLVIVESVEGGEGFGVFGFAVVGGEPREVRPDSFSQLRIHAFQSFIGDSPTSHPLDW